MIGSYNCCEVLSPEFDGLQSRVQQMELGYLEEFAENVSKRFPAGGNCEDVIKQVLLALGIEKQGELSFVVMGLEGLDRKVERGYPG